MKKIQLSLESLRVESFATASTEAGEGTVFGNAKTLDTCTACPSAIDMCPSSPHSATLPCNGCVETDFC
jgi:flavoprotein